MNKKKVLGIIGCGAIGSALTERAAEKMQSWVSGIVLYDRDIEKAEVLASKLKKVSIAGSMKDAVLASDLIVEAAHPEVARELLKMALEKRKDIMILSIGGLLGREELLDEAVKAGITVILPSGAVGGIDAIKAARIAGIDLVTLTTRKSPASLKGAPYLEENNIDIMSIKKETLVFEGSVSLAVKGFPKNINVSALLSMAGIGPEKTKVKIISSPEYDKNIHEICVQSKAGTFTFRAENVPFPLNPKTSYLAALSAMTALEEFLSRSRVGT